MSASRAKRLLEGDVPYALAIVALAAWTISAVRARTGGEPAVPLDDAFIHFAYARSFATFQPLSFTPGAPPTAGATSLLWSLALAPLWLLGLRDLSLVWGAWLLGYLALFGLAVEARKLAAGLVSPWMARFAGAAVIAFGGFAWSAGSGMEIVPFAWLLVRAARLCAEVDESKDDPRKARALAITAALLPLARPEGGLLALFAAFVLFRASPADAPGRSRARRLALAPLLGIALPSLVFYARTGRAVAATAEAKWLVFSPYHRFGAGFFRAFFDNLAALVGPIAGGDFPSAHVVPPGARVLVPASLVALAIAARRTGRRVRALAVLLVAVGIVIPATYETFLANRLRYLWPFVAGFLVLLAVSIDVAFDLAERFREGLGKVRLPVAGFALMLLVTELPKSIEDLAGDASAVQRQQVAVARWARDHLPATSVVGVNDAGAMAYLGGRRTFDVVGLTTRGEARYWVAGAGSRFEHWERLPREQLPTHFAVYPQWLQLPPVLGAELTHVTVDGAPILGAPTVVVAEASYAALGSGEAPIDPQGRVLDALDVADLESEAAHGFELADALSPPEAHGRGANVLIGLDARVDGGRLGRVRDRFRLKLRRGGRLLARVGAALPHFSLRVRIDGVDAGALAIGPGLWQELALPLGPHAGEASWDGEAEHAVELEAPPGRTFVSMHYWSLD
jgi:ABC-type amino acid transport substrate-binding protein